MQKIAGIIFCNMQYRYALNLQNTFTDLEEFKQNQRAKNKGRHNYN